MRQWSGHAQFEFTDDRFSRDAVHNATQQQWTHEGQTHTGHNSLSTTLTGNTGKQGKYTKYSGSENRSFMRNKGHVFFVSEQLRTAKIPC